MNEEQRREMWQALEHCKLLEQLHTNEEAHKKDHEYYELNTDKRMLHWIQGIIYAVTAIFIVAVVMMSY